MLLWKIGVASCLQGVSWPWHNIKNITKLSQHSWIPSIPVHFLWKINGSQRWSHEHIQVTPVCDKGQWTWEKQNNLWLKILRKKFSSSWVQNGSSWLKPVFKEGSLGNGSIYMTPLQCALAQKWDKRRNCYMKHERNYCRKCEI